MNESGPAKYSKPFRLIAPAAIVAASLMLSIAFYFGLFGNTWVTIIAGWTARWTSIGLGLIGISTSVDGTILSSSDFAVNVVAECTAIGPLLLFMGAVIAYPSRLKAKGVGLLLGIIVLTFVNVIRITSLFWIGSNFPQYLDIAHLLVWQSAIILLAIVLWLFWVERMASAGNR
jgi:archaeosortase B (VPXXXP-CTERM-specific)